MWKLLRPRTATLRFWQVLVLVVIFAFWWAMTTPGVIPPFMFENDRQAAFFFGEPLKIVVRIWDWFVVDRDIYGHLWVTLLETVLAFALRHRRRARDRPVAGAVADRRGASSIRTSRR